MSDDIKVIMDMTFCSLEEAEKALKKTANVFEAICLVMEAFPPKKEKSEHQKFFDGIRETLSVMEIKNAKILSGDRREPLELNEKKTHHEEKVQQNNCSQEYQPVSQELKEQKQEIDYP